MAGQQGQRRLRRFSLVRRSPLPPAEAWARVLDLRAHSSVAPLTRLTVGAVAAGDLASGHRFVARTGVGRLAFDDVMTVAELTPPAAGVPGRARIVKGGRVILGSVVVTVSADDGGSLVRWDQDFGLWRLGGLPLRLAASAARLAYGRALGRLLAG